MPNKNYISGRRFEYRVKKHLENKGWVVFRTAGSHSPVDLIAFRKGLKPCLIQCKYGKNGIKTVRMTDDLYMLGELAESIDVDCRITYNNENNDIVSGVVVW